jgi:hypothetical protein
MGQWRYSSTIMNLGTLDGIEWSASHPGKHPPYPLYLRLGGLVWALWRREKSVENFKSRY